MLTSAEWLRQSQTGWSFTIQFILQKKKKEEGNQRSKRKEKNS
jgi:hypothetical protein